MIEQRPRTGWAFADYEYDPDDDTAAEQAMGELCKHLPDIARQLITSQLDQSDPRNQAFAHSPDDPAEHTPEWHQYGIITHSIRTADCLVTEVPTLLAEWGFDDSVTVALDEPIDGIPKAQLLPLAAILHDIGKFTAGYPNLHAISGRSFRGHEEQSGEVVRTKLATFLVQEGLTDGQIEYIACCAELHFELGKVRRGLKARGSYSVGTTDSARFAEAAYSIMDDHPDYALEIGLLFLADNLCKSDLVSGTDSVEDVEAAQSMLTAQIAKRGLSPKLINQCLELPVNVSAARTYLLYWALQRPPQIPCQDPEPTYQIPLIPLREVL